MHTADISHDTLSIQDLACQHISCTNVNAKRKTISSVTVYPKMI